MDNKNVRDIVMFPKYRTNDQNTKLSNLAKEYLEIDFQNGEHSSVEDAWVALCLYRIYEEKINTYFKENPYTDKPKSKNKHFFNNKNDLTGYHYQRNYYNYDEQYYPEYNNYYYEQPQFYNYWGSYPNSNYWGSNYIPNYRGGFSNYWGSNFIPNYWGGSQNYYQNRYNNNPQNQYYENDYYNGNYNNQYM